MGWYRQGTASVANGSTAVTGTLTAWTGQAKAEDRITFDGGAKWYEIASVGSNTALTLATPFGEATVTNGAYAIDRSGRGWSIVSDLAARVAALLAMFPVLGGASDALKWFRANAAGDAFEFTAATPATVTVGSTTTGAPGSSASVANSGTSSDAVLDFTIPRGDTGAQGPPGADWKSAWLTATGYVARDVVKHNGSSYICTSGHTSGATTEPGVGVDWATVWDLFVEKGNTGDPGPTGVNWITGGWLTATAYAARDAVQHNGTSYICTSGHTSGATTEPGVGASWQTVWDVMAAKGVGDLQAANNLSDLANANTARANLYAAPFDAMAALGMQINGNMAVSQENGTSSVALSTGVSDYIVDQWEAVFVSAAAGTVAAQQVSATPTPPDNFSHCLKLSAGTADASLDIGEYFLLKQKIEGYRTAKLAFGSAAAKSVTIGFWVYASISGTMSVSLRNNATNRSYVTNVSISAGTTWEYKTVTIAGDTTGTWEVTTSCGIEVGFCFGGGSTFQTTADTWAAGNYFATSTTTNFFATNGNFVAITGVTVLPGADAPTSESAWRLQRPYDEELWLCMRHWQSESTYFNAGKTRGGRGYFGTGSAHYFHLPVVMRTTPTVSATNSGAFQYYNGSWVGTSPTLAGINTRLIVVSHITADPTHTLMRNTSGSILSMNARL